MSDRHVLAAINIQRCPGHHAGITGAEKECRLGTLAVIGYDPQGDATGDFGNQLFLTFAGGLGLPVEVALDTGAPHPAHMAAVDANIVFPQLQGKMLGCTVFTVNGNC